MVAAIVPSFDSVIPLNLARPMLLAAQACEEHGDLIGCGVRLREAMRRQLEAMCLFHACLPTGKFANTPAAMLKALRSANECDKGGARIVNVSSGMGELGSNYSEDIKARFLDPKIDREGLVALVNEFIRDVAAGLHAERGWPSSAYRVSKAAVNTFTRIVAKELVPRGILVNAVCPGWVRTDMGGTSAPRSVREGADTIVWCATLPDGGPTGTFFHDRKAIPW